jgi:predicted nucleotidyltransferase
MSFLFQDTSEIQMKTVEHVRDFLDALVSWASRQPDIQGIALVGSYARREARDDSDIDLVILTELPQKYLAEVQWPKGFGMIEKRQSEDYGKFSSLRIWYQNGPEVEYSITMAGSLAFEV